MTKFLTETPQMQTASYNSTTNQIGYSDFLAAAKPYNSAYNSTDEILEKFNQITTKSIKEEKPMSDRRIVQVFIVDPDEKLPLKNALLYQGEPHITDLTDNELFFEIPIKEKLEEHNEIRKKTEDKKAEGKEKKYLESIRIRDLKMTVIEIAAF